MGLPRRQIVDFMGPGAGAIFDEAAYVWVLEKSNMHEFNIFLE